MSQFISCFAPKLEAMLDYRDAHGFKRKTYFASLVKFDRYCHEQMIARTNLTDQLVYDWLEIESASNIFNKTMAIKHFGRYLCAMGEKAFVLPEKSTPKRRSHAPYIFTDDEMTALFAAIDRLAPIQNEPFIVDIAPVLFRLIYTCGLRPNEGRELKCENVDLQSGEVFITETKNYKDRIVVMSDDMHSFCMEYDLRRRLISSDNPYFFPSQGGGAISKNTVYKAFKKAWRIAAYNLANINNDADPVGDSQKNPITTYFGSTISKSPRVYDLRHRFASACLNRWLDEGENLMTMLPYLRTYMGHSTLEDTAYYIHILPEKIIKNAGIDWNVLEAIFPDLPPQNEESSNYMENGAGVILE